MNITMDIGRKSYEICQNTQDFYLTYSDQRLFLLQKDTKVLYQMPSNRAYFRNMKSILTNSTQTLQKFTKISSKVDSQTRYGYPQYTNITLKIKVNW